MSQSPVPVNASKVLSDIEAIGKGLHSLKVFKYRVNFSFLSDHSWFDEMSLIPLGWEVAKDSLHMVPSTGPKSSERTSEGGNWIPDLIRGAVFPSVPSLKWLLSVEKKSLGHSVFT